MPAVKRTSAAMNFDVLRILRFIVLAAAVRTASRG